MRYIITVPTAKVNTWEKVEKADRGRFRSEVERAVRATLEQFVDVSPDEVVVERLVIVEDK